MAGAALLVAVLAAWSDVRTRRIPNLLTLPAAGLGLVLHLVLHGREGLFSSLGGLGVGMLVLLPAYLGRMLGAGDVKLMAALGAWLGWPATVTAVLCSALAGGLLALWAALRRGVAARALKGAAGLGASLVGSALGAPLAAPASTGVRTPYGLAIAVGTAFAVWLAT
jgi:prepilin peptidase CpaA